MSEKSKSRCLLKIVTIGAIIILSQLVYNSNYKVLATEDVEQETQTSGETESTEPEIIVPVEMSKTTISDISAKTYTGKAIEPSVTVKYNNKTLVQGTDYKITYANNKNAGTATVTIEGIEPYYTGKATKEFTINKKKVSALKCTLSSTKYTYSGEERNAKVTVYNGSTKLKKGTDYTLTYKNNVKTGIATVTIKGKGNYTGSISRRYYIVPKKGKITSVMFNSKFTKATVKWKKDSQASGYAIYMSDSKNGEYIRIKTIKSNSTTKYTKTKLDSDKLYYFKVIAYRTVTKDGVKKNVYSKSFSEPKSNTGLVAEVKLTASSSTSNRNYNLKLASKKINGTILKPGQTFNWFTVVGPASKKKGYKLAIVFASGKSVQGYGGGVCQVSTTLYQASKKAGLKIVERHTHSKAVSYTTSGKDAAVSYGVQNLRIKNNKKYSIRLVTSAKKGSTTCKIYRVAD